jgi:PGF-pre-PGF domain-containing protein
MHSRLLLISTIIFTLISSPFAIAEYYDEYDGITGQVSRTFSKIQPSLPVSVTENVLAPAGTSVYEVRIDASTLILQARIFVEATDAEEAKLDVLPGGIVYEYVNITAKNIDDSDLDVAEIYFRVPKTWMAENNVGSSGIKMLRFHSGEWQELDTGILSDSEENVEYKATTPGFSVFAIAGETLSPITIEEEQIEDSDKPDIVVVEPTEDVVESRYKDSLGLILVIGVTVAVVAALFLIPGSIFRKKLRR